MADLSHSSDDNDCHDDDAKQRVIKLPGVTASVATGGALSLDVLTTGLGAGAKLVSFKSSAGADLYADRNGDLLYLADADKFLRLGAGQTKIDVISYKVEDAQGHQATGEITVTVSALDPAALAGTHKSNVLIGNDTNEIFFAGRGDDGVLANGGHDTIYGGAGGDQLFGGDGNDLIVGGSGGDWMYGDYGADTLVGGAGADVFVFTDFWADDVVLGFDPKRDKIQLPIVYFNSFADVKAAAHDDGHGNLVISTPDHTGAVSSITLVNTSINALKASDFVFI